MPRYLLATCFLLSSIGCGSEQTSTQLSGPNQSQVHSQQQFLVQAAWPSYETFEPEAQRALFARLEQVQRHKAQHPQAFRTPIFVITCDRISVLIKSLLSYYTRIDQPVDVIIHDNHTTYPPTRDFINRLEEAGIEVYHSNVDVIRDYTLSNISSTIASWYENHDSPFYVVTDPDIEIEEGSGNILRVLAHLLDENKQITVAGPMLRFDDIPDVYPLKQRVIKESKRVLGNSAPLNITWHDEQIIVRNGWIDSAFGMYRKEFKFHNYNRALLTYNPYQARHLDWYIDPGTLAEDQIYYLQKNSPVGHYSSTWLKPTL